MRFKAQAFWHLLYQMTLYDNSIPGFDISWIAALKEGRLFSPMTFVGSCNRDLFEQWLEQYLVPQLQPGDVIMIDNDSFHHGQAIEEIVAQAGCEIWYLPTYSPDLIAVPLNMRYTLDRLDKGFSLLFVPYQINNRYNKIEHWWFALKNWMRQRWDEFDDFRDCVDTAFKNTPNVFA
jgi:transposase